MLCSCASQVERSGDVIEFYNIVFIPSVKAFLLHLSQRSIPILRPPKMPQPGSASYSFLFLPFPFPACLFCQLQTHNAVYLDKDSEWPCMLHNLIADMATYVLSHMCAIGMSELVFEHTTSGA